MSIAVLDKLVSQKSPLPNIWKYVLGYVNSNSVPMKTLSHIFSRYLINSDISQVSEIEKLQIALQVCTFYNELNNEETAQNIITLLLDNGAKHQECLEFVAYLTSVASSSKCALYLQTFGILVSQETVIIFVCQKIISDNCISSHCYPELYAVAKIAPQFTLYILKFALKQIVQTLTEESSSHDKVKKPLADLCMNLVDQNETFLFQPEVLYSTLCCILLLPLHSSPTTLKKSNMRGIYDKLFRTIFLKLSSGEAKVGWESLRRISDLIKSYEITNPLKLTNKRGTSKTFKSNKVDESRDCLNQIILLLSHNKTSVDERASIASLIQETEFGEFLLQSLAST